MRTATTLAQTHTGQWVTLAYPDVPVVKQWQDFKGFKAKREHPDFQVVQYQESDQQAQVLRLFKPEKVGKSSMKKALSTVLVFAFLAFGAQAQTYTKLISKATVTASYTSNYTATATVVNTRLATVTASFALKGSGTENVTLTFDTSPGDGTWVTGSLGPLVIAGNGTTTVTASTNLDVGGAVLLRVGSVANASSQDLTNLIVVVTAKKGVEPTVPIAIAYGGTGASTAEAARASLGFISGAYLTNGFTGTITNLGSSVSFGATNAPINVFTNTAAYKTYWTNITGYSGYAVIGGGSFTNIVIGASGADGTGVGIFTNSTAVANVLCPVALAPGQWVYLGYSATPTMVWRRR